MAVAPMVQKLQRSAGWLFGLVFLWRLGLLLFAALPVPSNDAFFYDGPVVNYLLHGKYTNPSLALALPISGTEAFSAYPPLYQAVLLGWMAAFGTSAISAMSLHLVLFGLYLLLLFVIVRRLGLPAWAVQVGCLFLFVITFDDRPDSLAHVFGAAAVYSWIRYRQASARSKPWWGSAMVVLAVLCMATSLQIGTIYLAILGIGLLSGAAFLGERFPIPLVSGLVVIPAILAGLVVFGYPDLWAGFMEHARQTPSLTGWRFPRFDELLKLGRTVPGIIASGALLLWWTFRGRAALPRRDVAGPGGWSDSVWVVTWAATAAALAIVVASMFLLTPNSVFFAAHLQPLAVAGSLGLAGTLLAGARWRRLLVCCFLGLSALGAIRALGLSTWGLACARDLGYSAAVQRVRGDLNQCKPGQAVVLSSAYLYEAARHDALRWIHCDWMEKAERGQQPKDWEGLLTLKPARLILTQFDYYRRFQPLLARLREHPELASFEVRNAAVLPAPDSMKMVQRVVQHISWAPVEVAIVWR